MPRFFLDSDGDLFCMWIFQCFCKNQDCRSQIGAKDAQDHRAYHDHNFRRKT